MPSTSPFHEGELQVQRLAGEAEIARRNGSLIADAIIPGARPFIAALPYAVAATRDADGRPWAHLLLGEPGFARTGNDGRRVDIDLARTFTRPDDPFWQQRAADPRVGLLFIELGTRRRLRVNGTTTLLDGDSPPPDGDGPPVDGEHLEPGGDGQQLVLDVLESYPNCPKYIQRRAVIGTPRPTDRAPVARTGNGPLPAELQALVRAADTFFVASGHPERQLDASHRGGDPGFVRLLDDGTLEIPDYAGNSMFNTLGNLAADPRAGLLFVDFANGRTLQLTGDTELLWDQDHGPDRTGGTHRLWRLRVTAWRESTLPADVTWEFMDASPYNPS